MQHVNEAGGVGGAALALWSGRKGNPEGAQPCAGRAVLMARVIMTIFTRSARKCLSQQFKVRYSAHQRRAWSQQPLGVRALALTPYYR